MSHLSRAPTTARVVWGLAEPPLHVVVATADEPLQWSILDGFATRPRARITTCSTVSQCRMECTVNPPDVVILDLALLGEEPQALVCLATMVRPSTHIIALTRGVQSAIPCRFSNSFLSFFSKPVEVGSLVRLASRGLGGASAPDATTPRA